MRILGATIGAGVRRIRAIDQDVGRRGHWSIGALLQRLAGPGPIDRTTEEDVGAVRPSLEEQLVIVHGRETVGGVPRLAVVMWKIMRDVRRYAPTLLFATLVILVMKFFRAGSSA